MAAPAQHRFDTGRNLRRKIKNHSILCADSFSGSLLNLPGLEEVLPGAYIVRYCCKGNSFPVSSLPVRRHFRYVAHAAYCQDLVKYLKVTLLVGMGEHCLGPHCPVGRANKAVLNSYNYSHTIDNSFNKNISTFDS
jgi:hypothetical protein